MPFHLFYSQDITKKDANDVKSGWCHDELCFFYFGSIKPLFTAQQYLSLSHKIKTASINVDENDKSLIKYVLEIISTYVQIYLLFIALEQ